MEKMNKKMALGEKKKELILNIKNIRIKLKKSMVHQY